MHFNSSVTLNVAEQQQDTVISADAKAQCNITSSAYTEAFLSAQHRDREM